MRPEQVATGVQDEDGEEPAGDAPAAGEEPEVEWEVVRPSLLDPHELPSLKVGPDGKAIANPHLLHNIVAVL